MEETFNRYFEFLGKLGGTLDQLTELARRKNAAARRGDLLGVDECVKREQALSLALRGMDAKREKLLAELGLDGLPLSALAANSPEALRAEAKRVSDSLRAKYEIYRGAADAARTTLEFNLHEIERHLGDVNNGAPAGSVADIRA